MVTNIVNLISQAFLPSEIKKNTAVIKVKTSNPFANPFVSSESNKGYYTYAKNSPVQGGYFAGYYNGKSNIVGQRLFLEA